MSNYSHFATNAIHVGNEPDQWKCHAVVPPIFLSTTFEEKEPAVTYVRFWLTILIYLALYLLCTVLKITLLFIIPVLVYWFYRNFHSCSHFPLSAPFTPSR